MRCTGRTAAYPALATVSAQSVEAGILAHRPRHPHGGDRLTVAGQRRPCTGLPLLDARSGFLLGAHLHRGLHLGGSLLASDAPVKFPCVESRAPRNLEARQPTGGGAASAPRQSRRRARSESSVAMWRLDGFRGLTGAPVADTVRRTTAYAHGERCSPPGRAEHNGGSRSKSGAVAQLWRRVLRSQSTRRSPLSPRTFA